MLSYIEKFSSLFLKTTLQLNHHLLLTNNAINVLLKKKKVELK